MFPTAITDALTVSRALGHSQSTTTLNIYAHTFSTAQAKASEAIANALPLKPTKEDQKNGHYDQSMTKFLFPEKEKARKPLIFKAFRALQPGADDGT